MTESTQPRVAYLDTRGPYDLREVALMGFGHRNERSFDGVMRLAFCVDGDYEQQVGVELTQDGDRLVLHVYDRPGQRADLDAVARQVARVVSVDHDGAAFTRICEADPVLARLQAAAPGFRPALFYSPYEAAIWSVLSARRARSQGMALRDRLAAAHGTTFSLAGVQLSTVPAPSVLSGIESFPGLPDDRIPRLHAIAEAAQSGSLAAARLVALDPDEAMARLQELPGIGPFYSALIVIRACGHADVLSTQEDRSRAAVGRWYGLGHDASDAELTAIAERWRPFRTWATVLVRAVGDRPEVAAVA